MEQDQYKEWVKASNLPPMTGTQAEFAKWLIDNRDQLDKIGDLQPIFESIYSWVKKRT